MTVVILPGVIIGGAASTIQAESSPYSMTVGSLDTSSKLTILNSGRIQGRGGQGGQAGSGDINGSTYNNYAHGSGGGGQGTPGGSAGLEFGAGSPGSDGTSSAGGAGGSAVDTGSPLTDTFQRVPFSGYHSLNLGDVETKVYNANGEIWGGGAGGFPGHAETDTLYAAQSGASAGASSSTLATFVLGDTTIAGGYSIVGTNYTIIGGDSSPNLEGDEA